MTIDDEYFFIRKDDSNHRLPSLQPDTNTSQRKYWFTALPMTSPPLIFSNGWRDEFKQDRVTEQIADILFEGTSFVVCDALRHKLLGLDIPHLNLHPAVYIDDKEQWHEDYWYVSFSEQFACWDRTRSVFLPYPIVIGSESMYEIMSYVLDEDLLRRTPLQQRLLFQMGGTTTEMIVCHQSIASLFRGDGVRLQPVKDY